MRARAFVFGRACLDKKLLGGAIWIGYAESGGECSVYEVLIRGVAVGRTLFRAVPCLCMTAYVHERKWVLTA